MPELMQRRVDSRLQNPLLEAVRQFLVGGQAPIEPDLQSTQLGATPQPGQTRRPGVLPLTVDAQTGQLTWALPRALDILGNALPGMAGAAAAPAKALKGEQVLGANPIFQTKEPGMLSADEVFAKLKELKSGWEQKPWTEADQLGVLDFPIMGKMEAAEAKKKYELWGQIGSPVSPEEIEFVGKHWPDVAAKLTPTESPVWGDIPAGETALDVPFFGPMAHSDAKALFQNWKEKGTDIPSQVVEFGKTHFPNLLPKQMPENLSWEPEPRKASRMIYPEDFVGPPVPSRDLPLDEASRLQRAAEMGFNTDRPLYTGVPTWGVEPPIAFKDPQARSTMLEQAIFLSDKPRIAGEYTGGTEGLAKGAVFPVYTRADNPLDVKWSDWQDWGPSYSGDTMEAIIAHALEKGHDSITVSGLNDIGGPQTQYLMLDPNKIRSKFAKFDPKLKDANDLAATIALAFGIGGAAKVLPSENK